ncbi:nitroreductase/quinone reductase family protein [Mycobacterium sp. LTG2003]
MNDHPTIPEPVNVVVRALLRSPLHWAMSRNTMLLEVTGRKTGRVYRVPVSYSVDADELVCFTDSPWWKNLRDGAAVTASVRGKSRNATAQVVYGRQIADHLARHLRIVPRDARYHGVRLGPGKKPNAADLERAADRTAMIRVRIDR